MSSFMVIAVLICSSAALPTAHDPDGERDGETSRKIIGSSVVTSVSVVLNGDDPHYTDAVGKKVPRPMGQVASPINLLNPDRYEFYTFNDKGDLVKRLMSMSEIQSIVASGDTDGQMILQTLTANYQGNANVQEIVSSVQDVLNKEIASQKNNSAAEQVLDTPDVSSTWSMILPAIFGQHAEDVAPNSGEGIQVHSTNKIPLDKVNTAEIHTNDTTKITTTETPMPVQADTIATSVPSISPALYNMPGDNEFVQLPESEMVSVESLKTRPTQVPTIIDDESATPILLYLDDEVNMNASSTTAAPPSTITTTTSTSTSTKRPRRTTTPRSTTIRATTQRRTTTPRASTAKRTTTPRSTTTRRPTTPRTSTTKRVTIARTRRTTTPVPSTTEKIVEADELLETSSIANIYSGITPTTSTTPETITTTRNDESTFTTKRTRTTSKPRRTTTARVPPSRRSTTAKTTIAPTTEKNANANDTLNTESNKPVNEVKEEEIENLKEVPLFNRVQNKKPPVSSSAIPTQSSTIALTKFTTISTSSSTTVPVTTPKISTTPTATSTTSTTLTSTTTESTTTSPTTVTTTTTTAAPITTNLPTMTTHRRRPVTTAVPDSVNDNVADDFDRLKIEPLINQISQSLTNEISQAETTVSPVIPSASTTESMPTKTVASDDDLIQTTPLKHKPDSTAVTAQSEELNKETETTANDEPVLQFTSPTPATSTDQDEKKVAVTGNLKLNSTNHYDLIETTTTPQMITTDQQEAASFDTDMSFNQIIESLQQENSDFTEDDFMSEQGTTTNAPLAEPSATTNSELQQMITTTSLEPITTVTISEQDDDLLSATTTMLPMLPQKEQESTEQPTTVVNSESTENIDSDEAATTNHPQTLINDDIDHLSDKSSEQEAVAHVFKNNLLVVDEQEPNIFEIPTTTMEPPTTTDIPLDEEVIKSEDIALPLLTRTHPVVQQIDDMVSEFSSELEAQVANINMENFRNPSHSNASSMADFVEQAATVASILADNTNEIVDENFSIEQMQDSLSDVISQVADSTYTPVVQMTTIRPKSDDVPITMLPKDNFHKFESLSHVTEASVESKEDDANEIKYVTSIVKQTSSISTHTENPNQTQTQSNKTLDGSLVETKVESTKETIKMTDQSHSSTIKPISASIAEDILGLVGSIDESNFPLGSLADDSEEHDEDYSEKDLMNDENSTTLEYSTQTEQTATEITTTMPAKDMESTTVDNESILAKTEDYPIDIDQEPAFSLTISTSQDSEFPEITTASSTSVAVESSDYPSLTTELPEIKTDKIESILSVNSYQSTEPFETTTTKFFETTTIDQSDDSSDYSDDATPMLLETTEYYFQGPESQPKPFKDFTVQETTTNYNTEDITPTLLESTEYTFQGPESQHPMMQQDISEKTTIQPKTETITEPIPTTTTTQITTTPKLSQTSLKPSAPKIDDSLKSDSPAAANNSINIDDKVVNHINTQRPSMSSIKIPALNPLKIERLPTTKRKTVQVKLESPAPEMLGLEESTKTLSEDIKQFADLCNELAFSFWKSLTKEGISSARSLVVSPFAMTSMLSMVFLGARGATSGEMNEILQLDDMVTFNPHLILRNITDSVENPAEAGLANSVFVRELYTDRNRGKVISFYKEKAQQLYSGHVEEVSYNIINDIIRRRTNLLVKRHTFGKMPEYLKTNSIWLNGPLSAMSVNIYETDCSSASTSEKDGEMFFQVLPTIRQRKLVPIPAAVYKSGFSAGYDPAMDATAVAFGAQNNIVSTIFIMPGQQGSSAPGDSLERLEQTLTEKALSENMWANLLKTLIDRPGLEVQIPRFSHRSFINATSALQKMGLKDVFNADKADLRGVTGSSNRDMYLSDMVQMNTFSTCGEDKISDHHHIEIYPAPQLRQKMLEQTVTRPLVPVDDETADAYFFDPLFDTKYLELPLPLRPRQARLPDIPRLRFDRPFLYFARHNPTGVILYMGRFNPRLLP